MRRNKEWKKGKEGRPAFGKKGQWVTRQTLDLSCIIEPVDHPPRPRSAREREAEEEEEDSQMAVAGRKRGALPPRRRGGLYLSGARTVTRDSHLLPEFHITAILNAADNVAYKSVAGLPDCRFHSLPLRDNDANACVPIRDVLRAIEFIDEELQRGNVLVHCRGGINRSAGLVVLYMMKKRSCGWREAKDYVRERRDINVHMGLQKILTSVAFASPSFFEPPSDA